MKHYMSEIVAILELGTMRGTSAVIGFFSGETMRGEHWSKERT